MKRNSFKDDQGENDTKINKLEIFNESLLSSGGAYSNSKYPSLCKIMR